MLGWSRGGHLPSMRWEPLCWWVLSCKLEGAFFFLFSRKTLPSNKMSSFTHFMFEWHKVSPSSLSVSLPWLFAVRIRGLERIKFEEKRQCQNTACASVLQGFKCISHSPSKETRKGKQDPGSCLFYTLLLKGKYSLGFPQKHGKAEKHKLRQMMTAVKDGQERRNLKFVFFFACFFVTKHYEKKSEWCKINGQIMKKADSIRAWWQCIWVH